MDLISNLASELHTKIVSFLPTRAAVVTSSLSKQWRTVFTFSPNLEFEFNDGEDQEGFIQFVDRVLEVRGNRNVCKFSLTFYQHFEEAVLNRWIEYALDHRVETLELRLHEVDYQFPPRVFVQDTISTLKLSSTDQTLEIIEGVPVNLVNLTTLSLEDIGFGENSATVFTNFISSCPVIDTLVLKDLHWERWEFCSVTSATLRRLRILWTDHIEQEDFLRPPPAVSFDTPSLISLEYQDHVAGEYPMLNLGALVKAKISLQIWEQAEGNEGVEIDLPAATNPAALLLGINGVESLQLSETTVQVLAVNLHSIPVFNNLTQLDIESSDRTLWDGLPVLLRNCLVLEKLNFHGLLHVYGETCGNICPCRAANAPSCLVESTVLLLKIFVQGDLTSAADRQILFAQARHFLVNMPNLVEVQMCSHIPETRQILLGIATGLQMIPGKASAGVNINALL